MTFQRLLIVATILTGLTAPASAAHRLWGIAGSGDWSTAANWSGGVVPDSADSAEVGEASGNGGTAVISTTVSDVLYFYLGQSAGETGSLEIRSGGSLTTTGNGYHYVGQHGNGYLTVAGGNLNVSAGHLFVGFSNPNGYGKVVQTGGSVSVAQDVYLSEGSTTTGLYELSGGTVSASRFLVGLRGTGQMDHTGGTLTVASPRQDLTLGWYTDGRGTYNLSGTASQIVVQNSGSLRVGGGGTGVFNQSNGSVTVANRLDVGSDATSNGTYNLSGGAISALRVNVGASGTGLFRQTGGTVTATGSADSDVIIGVSIGSSGRYEIGGAAQLNVADDLVVGSSGTGTFRQTGGQVMVTDQVIVGNLSGSSGTLDLDGGTLAARALTVGLGSTGVYRQTGGEASFTNYVYVGDGAAGQGDMEIHGGSLATHDLRLGNIGRGILVQDGGQITVTNDLYMAVDAASTSEYRLNGGDISSRRIIVGLSGDGTLIQTGGNISVRTGSSPNLVVAYYTDSRSTYEIRGGTVSAQTIYNGLNLSAGHGGIGLMRVVGDAATIEATTFYQNERSTLEMHVGNGGVSRIQVSGTATLRAGSQLNMGLAGGAALLTAKTFDLLTANSIIDGLGAAGTFTLAGPEPLWDISQSSTLVRATLAGAGLGPVAANYDTFVELEVDGGTGSVAGYSTVTDLTPGRTFWALLNVEKAGEALAGTALAELAEYIESAGHTVYTTHPILDSGCGVTGEYNLMFDLDVLSETAHFAWDFSEYDPLLRVTHVALGVPEPGTFVLGVLGFLMLLGRRRRTVR
ncbi:MAG: hypothetical protein U1E05_13730 [Patescibacteria group bacterium]|nr:hypothetical protein [Patescibacteria group bacterium]